MSRGVDTMVTVTNFTRVLVLRHLRYLHETRASDVCVKRTVEVCASGHAIRFISFVSV